MNKPVRATLLVVLALLLAPPSGLQTLDSSQADMHQHGSIDPNASLAALEGPPVTRYELAALFHRFASGIEASLLHEGVTNEGDLPADVPADHWAAPGVRYLAASGALPKLMRGARFDGDQPAAREDVALLFHHLTQRLKPAFVRIIPGKTVNLQKIRVSERAREAMYELAKGGWLPYESPIFHANEPTVSPPVMAVALAQYAKGLGRRLQPKDDGLEGE